MSNTIRIKTTPNGGDKYLKVKIDQDFDFIEILSLKLTQEDAYRKFCSDYGAVVGRVVVNSGFGVPNAKVSVFIPIDDIDKNDPLIKGLYPYELVTDKNSDGVRYNLLPREFETNNDCFTPIGTFPSKREILDNDTMMEIYCKYYKFTTTTNHAGDFMIFGVPLGSHVIHVDADLSDIDYLSQRPYDMIRQGASERTFESSTKFKSGSNLDKLPQVKSSNIGVNVQPFWGDTDNCEVGITRVDIDLNYNVEPCAIFMGSIFGDQDKDSVNKNCRPRKGLGELCSQIAGEGTVEMIRKTVDGSIEQFDVEGGYLIDEDGTWAYQVPMNLDYVVTSEEGDLVPSSDPNIGIPTRASVRFRIGMGVNGGEGRLRTRAKYLVPNNPTNAGLIDYTFDERTNPFSFKDLYWNKIYTVSNFISRYQRLSGNIPSVPNVVQSVNPLASVISDSVKTRAFTGIKDVSGCVGDKTPFPYNKLNATTNPIFASVCVIMEIIIAVVYLINKSVIALSNALIHMVKVIINAINTVLPNSLDINDNLNYIPCMTITCADEKYAPGCPNSGLGQYGWSAAQAGGNEPNYYPGDGIHSSSSVAVGLDDCMALQMANSLNIYQFDFYNDWVNGSLYSFLLKYKKKRKGKEKFCEYDCIDFSGDQNYSGVGNDCNNATLLDTCINFAPLQEGQTSSVNVSIREGLVKKFEDELYYAATTHNGSFKLFATDIVCLGSIFECDWQGFPMLQPYLVSTSFNLPPDVSDSFTDPNTNITYITETGMIGAGGTSNGLFFEINCAGLHVNENQCLNIRHACEIYVDNDELYEQNNVLYSADGTLGSNDISELGRIFRDSFTVINSGITSANSFSLPANINTDFNINNLQNDYNYTSQSSNGVDYLKFRGFYGASDSIFLQPKHSYYFYFGIIPGKTALDKMNAKYFSLCKPVVKSQMAINITTTPDSANDGNGKVDFVVLGGLGPYTYTVTGPNGIVAQGTIPTTTVPPSVAVNGLFQGQYTVTVVDSTGNATTNTFNVGGPTPLYCSVAVSQNSSSASAPDGAVTVYGVGGGIAPYTYVFKDYNGSILQSGTLVTPMTISNLMAEPNFGYVMVISDSFGAECETTGLIVNGPTVLFVRRSQPTKNVTCYGGNDGELYIGVSGGLLPYSIYTTGPNGYINQGGTTLTNLIAGTYYTTVSDATGANTILTSIVGTTNPQLVVSSASAAELAKQCDPQIYHIPFYILTGLANNSAAFIQYTLDNGQFNYQTQMSYVNATTPIVLTINKTLLTTNIKIRFSNTANYDCLSNELTINVSQITLPTTTLSANITTSGLGNPFTHNIKVNGGIVGSPAAYTSTNNPTYTNSGAYYSATVYNNQAVLTETITDGVGCSVTAIG